MKKIVFVIALFVLNYGMLWGQKEGEQEIYIKLSTSGFEFPTRDAFWDVCFYAVDSWTYLERFTFRDDGSDASFRCPASLHLDRMEFSLYDSPWTIISQYTDNLLYLNDGNRHCFAVMSAVDHAVYYEMQIFPIYYLAYWDTNGRPVDNNKELVLPASEKIKIVASREFSSYAWEYSLDAGRTWFDLNQFKGVSEIRFCGNDIPEIYAEALQKKSNIQIRVKSCGESEILILVPKLSSPNIVSTTVTNPSCPGGSDGKVVVTFDRELFADESLKVLMRGGSSVDMAMGTTRCELGGLSATTNWPWGRTDSISLSGSYRGTHVYDSDPVGHRAAFTVTDPPAISISRVSSRAPYCHGGTDGQVSITGSGGTGALIASYFHTPSGSWLTGGSGGNISGLAAGSYRVRLQDSKGCLSAEQGITLSDPSAVSLLSLQTSNLSGYGRGDGQIEVKATGGTPVYTYRVSKGGTPVTGSNGVFSGLSAGTYSVEAFDAAYSLSSVSGNSGCKASSSVTLSEPALLVISSLTVSSAISCKGGMDGSLSAVASGGVLPYTYIWERESSGVWHSFGGNQTSLLGLASGNYRVRVSDRNGNVSAYVSLFLSEPSALSVDFSAVLPSCNGYRDGRLTVSASGGNGGYNYLWSHGSSTATCTGLSKGLYIVRATDSKGCVADGTFTLSEPELLDIASSTTLPTSYGSGDGIITLIVSGGTPSYTFRIPGIGVVANPITSLPACDDSYHILVSDVNGCKDSTDVLLLNPVDIRIAVGDSISCHGLSDGSLIPSVRGGVGAPYRFTWECQEPDGRYRLVGIDSLLVNTGSGTYRLTVRDGIGTESVLSSFVFNEPDELMSSLMLLSPSCKGYNDGRLTCMVSGGTSPYKYYWSTGDSITIADSLTCGSYTVNVLDRRGCQTASSTFLSEPDSLVLGNVLTLPSAYDSSDGSIFIETEGGTAPYAYYWSYQSASSNPLIGLAACDDPYEVEVTDSHGCVAHSSPRLIYPITSGILIRDSVFCVGYTNGVLAARVIGGVGKTYRYRWFRIENGIPLELPSTDSLLCGVGAGVYRLKAYDRENNLAESPDFIFGTPALLEVSFSRRDLLCKYDSDGLLTAHPRGGTGPYFYLWGDGSTSSGLTGLEEGIYPLTVTDSRGCMAAVSDTIFSPSELLLSMSYREPIGYGYGDGKVWVTAVGGSAPYTYAWPGFTTPSDTVFNIPAGRYEVGVSDSHRCHKTKTVEVTEPAPLVATVKESRFVLCHGDSNGVLSADVQGGVSPVSSYTWYREGGGRWDAFSSEMLAAGVPSGTYRVRVLDANLIESWSEPYFLSEPERLVASMSTDTIVCNGDRTGRVEAFVEGGSKPYHYLWTTNDTVSVLTNISDGRYLVWVTDVRGCTASAVGEVVVPGGIVLRDSIHPPVCFGSSDGFVHVSVSGGVSPYAYRWSTGASGAGIDGLSSGDYTLRVTDSHGCFRDESYRLPEAERIVVDLGDDRTLCSSQSLDLDAGIPDGSALYRWYFNGQEFSSSHEVTVQDAGTYRVLVSDTHGCIGSDTLQIYRSDDDVTVNFAVSSSVELGKELRLVNTSYPLPDGVEWIFPVGAEVLEDGDDEAGVVMNREGSYRFGLKAWKGACWQTLYKTVEVGEVNGGSFTGNDEPLIRRFSGWPNPSSGSFRVGIELREACAVRLHLMNMRGEVLDIRKGEGDKRYEYTYDLSLSPGVYLLQLFCGGKRETFKILIGG